MKGDFEGARFFSANLILDACLKALLTRSGPVLQLELEEAVVATIVFPKFKFRWFSAIKTQIKLTIDSLKQMVIAAAQQLILQNLRKTKLKRIKKFRAKSKKKIKIELELLNECINVRRLSKY